MARRNRREIRLFSRFDGDRRPKIGFSDSADYRPLTVVPSTSRMKRPIPGWMMAGALVALGGALVLALQNGIPAW
jgi:hypothetical protein